MCVQFLCGQPLDRSVSTGVHGRPQGGGVCSLFVGSQSRHFSEDEKVDFVYLFWLLYLLFLFCFSFVLGFIVFVGWLVGWLAGWLVGWLVFVFL